MHDVGAIVVHHRHPEVIQTVRAILASGVEPASLVVVDNSEDEAVAATLRQEVPAGVRLRFVPNRGYAAAVNAGHHELVGLGLAVIIVATHEVRPEAGTLRVLADALRDDPRVGVAGPTLLLPPRPLGQQRVWSFGGRLSPVLGWPQHVRAVDDGAAAVVARDWLDGALCAYRSQALGESLREDFFMYVEELEFHRRLGSLGWVVVWVPAARATQDTEGAPPYLQARNLQMYYAAWGSRLQRVLAVPLLILRQLVVRILRRRQPRAATAVAVRGWRDGVKAGRTGPVPARRPGAFQRF